MKTLKTIITLAVSALSVSMSAVVSAAEIPRATAPLNATEEQILIVENIIGDILDEVQNGLGYAEPENKAEPRVYKAVITGETNGNGYGILSDIMRNAIRNVRDMYLRPEVYQEAEEWLKVLLADTITEVENGLDINTAIKEAHTKIYLSINPAFNPEAQFSIDTCYQDIPAVDMAVYNRTRKVLDDAHKIYIYPKDGRIKFNTDTKRREMFLTHLPSDFFQIVFDYMTHRQYSENFDKIMIFRDLPMHIFTKILYHIVTEKARL